MTVENADVIDIVAHDSARDWVLLVMVEAREWGVHGRLLPDLQRKLTTYLNYATEGQLLVDHLHPMGIRLKLQVIGSSEINS